MRMINLQRLPNRELTLDEFFTISDEAIFAKGGESVICRTDKKDTLFKFFVDRFGNFIDMSDNKLQKIIALYQMNLSHSVHPVSTITVGKYLVGYEMSYNPNAIEFKKARLESERKIEILERTKCILEYFASKDIVYGDVKSNNILLDQQTGEIEFCDMDNIQLGEYSMDLVVEYVQPFKKCGKIELADAYNHNLMSLQQLGFPNDYPMFKEVLQALVREIYPASFTKEAIPIFESMTLPRKFNGEYAIQYVKKQKR